MNWDQVEGKWKQYSGKAREKWGKLTDSDFEVVRGKQDQLLGKIQERYGITKEAAQKQINEFVNTLQDEDTDARTADASSHRDHKASRSAGRS